MNTKEENVRILELIICVQTFIVLVLLCITTHFVSESIKYSPCDVNKDGKVTITDVVKTLNAYLNEDIEPDGSIASTDLEGNVNVTN